MATMPTEPMLARPVDEVPLPSALPGGCAYEPKWDGYRAFLAVMDGRGMVQSRRGKDITRAFPEIAAAGARLLPDGTVLDGELVIMVAGRLEFTALQRRIVAPARARLASTPQPATFLAFDLLTEHGVDVTARPLRQRRHRLEELFRDVVPPLQLTPQTTDLAIARQWLDDYASAPLGVEGLVIKGLADPYLPGRRGWLKYRIRDTYEVIVAAVTGSRDTPERLVLGLYDTAGELVVAGGTVALKARQRAQVRPLLRPPQGRHPWPTELPVGRMGVFGGGTVSVTPVEPFVVEVAADQSFDYGRWRHLARFVRARPDLSTAETSGPMD